MIIEAVNSELSLGGICRFVIIAGSNDNVLVEISSHGKLMISGKHNAVIWSSSPEGPEPIVMSTDESNTVLHLRSKSDINVPLVTIEATGLVPAIAGQ